MTPKPRLAIKDLKFYLRPNRFRLSNRVEEVFLEAEQISERYDTTLLFECVLLAFVNSSRRFQSSLLASGSDLSLIANLLDEYIKNNPVNSYDDDGLAPYSSGNSMNRKRFIDRCLDKSHRNSRKEIVEADLLEALMELPEELRTPLVETSDKRYIDARRRISQALFLTGTVPPHIRDFVFRFRKDFPYYERNCFLVMSFSTSASHRRIYRVLEATLSQHKLNLLRADKKEYAADLLSNIETYIYGCSFAIAIFERIEDEVYNPNVSFEVGYLSGLTKPVCLLKEKTMRTLSTDLIGKLYREFDIQDLETTIPAQVEKWLSDKRII
ncbi:MAG TPA: hypothetical protein VI837_08140 [Blastocatellia bacterium]|nr:hypothetical protein [Blastocatellia bacterium]